MKRMTLLRKCLLLACMVMLRTLNLEAAVIYVHPGAGGANNGTSWANAYTSLTSALNAAVAGDEIWVVQGVYKPVVLVDVDGSGGVDPREATFQIPNGVMLYGGFVGTEVSRSERNWEANLTILSGDIDNNDINADGNFIAESTDDIVGDNAYHVVYTVNVNSSTGLDGFIVTAGSANISFTVNISDPNLDGGGWYNRMLAPSFSSSPSILNTVFQGNYAESEGAALYSGLDVAGGTVTSFIRNCHFENNKSNFGGGAIFMGSLEPGIYQPIIQKSVFIGNEAYTRGGAIQLLGDHAQVDSTTFQGNKVTAVSLNGNTLSGFGGAVSLISSNAQFNNCYFHENQTTGNPTGPWENGGGGAIYISTNVSNTDTLGTSEPSFINCGFYENTAAGNGGSWGGAIVHFNDGGILKPNYVNCIFAGNEAQNHGGAVANFTRVIDDPSYTPILRPAFTNCTFASNQAGQNGGGIYNNGDTYNGSQVLSVSLINTIVWNNSAPAGGAQIFNQTPQVYISHSLIQNSGGSGAGWNNALGIDGGNNIALSPAFVNIASPLGADGIPATSDDGLRLAISSPAIDVGNNAAPDLVGVPYDYMGNSRFLGSKVDMGAYERAGLLIPGLKLTYWVYDWGKINPPCLTCPWSVLLADEFFRGFAWDGPAQLIQYEDYAVVTGNIRGTSNRNASFEVYFKLVKPQDWKKWQAQRRTFLVSSPEALRVALKAHPEWTFWELSDESYLKGTGDLSGTLKLSHFPANYKTGFQLGDGANGWDSDFGLGGFFEYRGNLVIKQKRYSIKGVGSLNIDAKPCPDCEPLIEPEEERAARTILPAVADERPSVFPNPAKDFLSVKTEHIEGSFVVRVYNDKGELKQTEQKHASDGIIELSLNNLRPGLYYLRVTTAEGDTKSHKFLVE